MVFFCFSSKDRQAIVESILYHLDNYCIPVWYDRRTMLMSDQRNYKNFVEGVGSCRYAVIILSPNCVASKCANEEIELIKALQILSVDSPHKSASQISSCNGTRRTAGHVHPGVRI